MTSKASKQHSANDEQGRDRVPLRLIYAPDTDEFDSKQYGRYVLGEIRFESTPTTAPQEDIDHLRVCVSMPQLSGPQIKEYWLSSTPVVYRRQADIRFGVNDQVLFGCAHFTLPATGGSLEAQIQDRYEAMLELLQSEGYPHLVRVWNYLPRIGDDIEGMECYRRFCRARHHAFEAFYEELIPNLPATSVLGTSGTDLQMVFLASQSSPYHYENPRQVSAYYYPQKYGPKSPLFARATLLRWDHEDTLFISGTASIVGHESRHWGDARAQAEEILRNIEALISHVSQSIKMVTPGLSGIRHLRVYLRHSSDLGTVRQIVEGRLGAPAEVVYLQAGICRRELLVEMEALLGLKKPT
jgi:chorismate lyase/3-hydroxybenzoate synthase